MDTLLNVNISQQAALRRQMDVIANNLANMNTTAYKGERVLFDNFLVKMDSDEGPRRLKEVNYLLDYGTIRAQEDGALEVTQSNLDIALQGPGYLTVEDSAGDPIYTRRGRMMIDTEGFLSILSGERVLDRDGNTIEVQPVDGDIQIDAEGFITGDQGPITALNLVQFANERGLLRQGGSMFRAGDQTPEPAEGVTVIQGAVELSNINAIQEVTRMIDVLRSYQAAQSNADGANDLRELAIDRLARVG